MRVRIYWHKYDHEGRVYLTAVSMKNTCAHLVNFTNIESRFRLKKLFSYVSPLGTEIMYEFTISSCLLFYLQR
jgi:hypothetical protein